MNSVQLFSDHMITWSQCWPIKGNTKQHETVKQGGGNKRLKRVNGSFVDLKQVCYIVSSSAQCSSDLLSVPPSIHLSFCCPSAHLSNNNGSKKIVITTILRFTIYSLLSSSPPLLSPVPNYYTISEKPAKTAGWGLILFKPPRKENAA